MRPALSLRELQALEACRDATERGACCRTFPLTLCRMTARGFATAHDDGPDKVAGYTITGAGRQAIERAYAAREAA